MRTTRGQGSFTYRVDGVRRANDPLPPPLQPSDGRLTLVTVEGGERVVLRLGALRPARGAGKVEAVCVSVGDQGGDAAVSVSGPSLDDHRRSAKDTRLDLLGFDDLTRSTVMLPEVRTVDEAATRAAVHGSTLESVNVSAWFGQRKVLEQVSLVMKRILNRMHELVPGAALAGEVRLDGEDIYEYGRRVTETRRRIGMVFQKPNPFPAMSIADNVLVGLRLTGTRVSRSDRDAVIEECLTRAGLWREVRDPFFSRVVRCPAASSSGCASRAPWRYARMCS